MKRLTYLALAAMTLAPATTFAASWSEEVTNADEFKARFNSIGAGIEGETYEIICNWDPTEMVSVGKLKPTMTKGKLIIRSNETDFDKMPQLQIAFEWAADAPKVTTGKGKGSSVIIENMNIVGTGSYVIDNRRSVFIDTLALRRCDIHDNVRSVLRYDGDKQQDGLKRAEMSINYIEVSECKIHGQAQASSDNWSVFRTFMPLAKFVIKDNIFYNMPYTKSLWETRDPNEGQTEVIFQNNMVLVGENKDMHSGGFTVLAAGANIAANSTFHIYNNIFAGPKAGYNIFESYTGTKITNAEGATILARNNVIDNETYMPIAEQQAYLLTLGTPSTLMWGADGMTDDNIVLSSVAGFSWETGATFQDPANNLYNLLKNNPWYTSGVLDAASILGGVNIGATYIGPSIAYVDEFPTPAAINITVEGPSYITYSVSPEKDVYYLDDEVTITLNPGTNNYLTNLNTFEGWSDGVTELSRTEKLTGDLNLTAKFTDNRDVVSAFTLNGITKNGDYTSYAADVYLDMDPSFQSVVYAVVVDTTEATGTQESPFHYMTGTPKSIFQARPAKFGEDPVELQMPILSNRTPAIAKKEARNHAVFVIPTKGITDLHFSLYVGTDNNAMSNQILEFSTDSTTWTKIAELAPDNLLQNLEWGKLEANLPAEANDKEKVYIRLMGDITSEPVCTPDEGIGMWIEGIGIVDEVYSATDGFEYFGSILITGDTSKAITGISEVATDEQKFDENAPMYNIMGMKVAKGTKGLIIQNGKKFVVK